MKLHFSSNPTLVWFVASLLLLLVGLAGIANAQIAPPVCPSKDCSKVITFYNNTPGVIFPVIQAGIQNPDPWLQALFNDNTKTYAETHYSRAYINPVNGIPPGGHVSVTVPWYSQLSQDVDQFIDWYNGGRIYIFDSAAALSTAHKAYKDSPLSFTSSSPVVSCQACEQPLTIYKDTLAYPPSIPFQLVEYTFADVGTPAGGKPYIIDLNVGYNVSYLDQIYLPVALAPCRTEPCNSLDPTAVGYLGTIQSVNNFRSTLTQFSNTQGWPLYNDSLDDATRPRLPGTDNVLVDRVNVIEKHQQSQFTAPGAGPNTAKLGKADSVFTNWLQRITQIAVPSGSNLQNLNLPIWPNGVVYNSMTRAPIAGVKLNMLSAGGRTLLPTACFDDPAQQGQITQTGGFYRFDINFSDPACSGGGSYLVEVTAPTSNYVAGESKLIPATSDQATAPFSVPACPGSANDALPTVAYCEAQASEFAPPASVPAGSTGTRYFLNLTLDGIAVPGSNQIYNNHIPLD